DAGDTGADERRGAKADHVAGEEDDEDASPAIALLYLSQASLAQQAADQWTIEDALSPVTTGPVEAEVAADDAEHAGRQGQPPVEHALMGQDTGEHDRDFLGDREAQAAEQQDDEQPPVREVLDEPDHRRSTLQRVSAPSDSMGAGHHRAFSLGRTAASPSSVATPRSGRRCLARDRARAARRRSR